MTHPFSLAVLDALDSKNAWSGFSSLGGTVLDESREIAIDRGERFIGSIIPLDEQEQLRHLDRLSTPLYQLLGQSRNRWWIALQPRMYSLSFPHNCSALREAGVPTSLSVASRMAPEAR